ncbi:MAG: VOC family protein [Candidatus Rokubacteria bacterium]|nr:VOC family protein [Candidatus Rokubacteria bacterium]MBI3826305.1 VOC family protein [Candidatus Rokubacteria bacterium]
MAITVVELHHHGIRIGPRPEQVKEALIFYRDVLGLSPDSGRPHIPTIDGYWMDVGGGAQIHLMGVEGLSRFAQGSPERDPSSPHVALAVPDVQEAKTELDRLGVTYWVIEGVVGPQSLQIFLRDPFGNMIELHQVDTCRCVARTRAGT